MSAEDDDEKSVPALPTAEELDRIPDAEVRSKIAYWVERGSFQSPLLPPEVLARYGNVIPGLPEKFVQWAEEESQHRRAMERKAFEEVRVLRARSQLSGVLVAVVGLCVSGAVATFGNSAGASFVAAVIAVVSVGGPFAARVLASRMGRSDQDPN